MSLIHEALEKIDQEKKERKSDFVKIRKETPWVVYGIAVSLVCFFIAGVSYVFTVPFRGERTLEKPKLSSGGKQTSSFLFHSEGNGRFILTGITKVGGDWTAIVNNELVRVGDSVSGASVEAIEPEKVLLNVKGERIALNLYGEGSTRFQNLEVTG